MPAQKKITRNTPAAGRPQLTFPEQKRLFAARAKEYSIQGIFKYGYRNKEDVSNLPPNTLILGSQNVLTNASEQVGIRQGYVLDGAAGNQNNYGIDSSYDFENRQGNTLNLRKWGSNLEVRYVNPIDKSVSWTNVMATLNTNNVANFTSFWDPTNEVKRFCLFVNGNNSIYEWSGGVASFASATAPTPGTVATVTINAAGTLYMVGDVLTLIGGGGSGCTLTVTSTGVSGSVTGVSILTQGSGYTTSTGLATTSPSPTGGSGCTINITVVATAGSITIAGTLTTDQLGFYSAPINSGKFKLLDKNGNTYSYTGVSNQTFLGVTPDASTSFAVGDPVIQAVATTNGALVVGPKFEYDLIATLANQVWYGSFSSSNLFVSRTNNYTDVTFSTPARLPAEGALITLDAYPIGFAQLASELYISAGRDQWWISQTNQQTISVTVSGINVATPTETLYAARLKTALNQGAQTQGLISNFKNTLVYVSNEQIINSLGLVKDVFTDPQVVNLSDPIKYDVDAYDFSGLGGDVAYDNYFIYVSVPKNNVVRMYNIQKNYWEAPQTLPVGRFYHVTSVIGNVLYGHSASTNESYQLFTGYNDNGNPINAIAAFAYTSSLGGSIQEKKSFNKIYTEGYISGNTTLNLTANFDFGGFSGNYSTEISGADNSIIFGKIVDGSLGQDTLGTQPIGTILNLPGPAFPKFRSIKTMPRTDMFEYQLVYSSNDVDQYWSILRFGPAISAAAAIPVEITE